MEFFDSHAHYNDEKFSEDREEIIKETLENDVSNFIVAGYNLESSKKALEIANKYKEAYVIVGVSPNDIEYIKNEKDIENTIIELEKIIQEDRLNKIVAIGEIGLDYYWNKENKELQKKVFIKQIELANKLELPIVIHTREAVYDTLDILKNVTTPIRKGVFHCCPLNVDLIREGLKLGFYISFAGPITFKNCKNANEAIGLVPKEKILIETDSPYLAPEPKRGTRNDSSNVRYIAEKISIVKNKSTEEVAKITYENAKKIFGIKD